MYISRVLLFGLLSPLAYPSLASHIRHEHRDLRHDAQWTKRGKAPADTRMPVKIAIRQSKLEYGHDMLMDISDPGSPNFGKHMTSKEVTDFFSPARESIMAITEWLAAAGIGTDRHTLSTSRSWIIFDASVEELEELIQAEYYTFTHKETNQEHVACDEYHVPYTVHPHIDFITPTISMAGVLKKRVTRRAEALSPDNQQSKYLVPSKDVQSEAAAVGADTCYAAVTPACIQQAYGIPNGSSAQPGNELGIFEAGNYYDQEDLDTFWETYTNVPNGTAPTLNSIDGGIAPAGTDDGYESLLDFQIAIPMIYPQSTILYQVNDVNEAILGYTGGGNTFLDAIDASYCTFDGGDDPSIDAIYPDTEPGGYDEPEMCGTYTPTNVISVSYGQPEVTWPKSYVTRQCQEYMKLGLQGVSVIFASGDNGVGSIGGCAFNGGAFTPYYGASCPYVTAVGATQINQSAAVSSTEVAVGDASGEFYSGGGFSAYFSAPSYQASTLATYFAGHNPPYNSSLYNASGRGFPDVSALGTSIVTIVGGVEVLQSGTSASAPLFAGIITLINEQRLAAGKSPVGFLNPTLYANPDAFTDITSGSNPGCNTLGFDAVTGWDPVTGLGTPKFSSLLDVFMKLP